MAVASNRKQIEIPKVLWEALDEVARKQDMPTGALAAIYIWKQLRAAARRPGGPADGIQMPPRPYHQVNILPRRGEQDEDDE